VSHRSASPVIYPIATRRAGRSGLVSLNAHYHLRVPFSLHRVHLIVRPVWVVVMRAGCQVGDKERPFSLPGDLRVGAGRRAKWSGRRAGHLTSEQPRNPAARLSG
jgi:hypothetical protein